jgi:uncharacterized protein
MKTTTERNMRSLTRRPGRALCALALVVVLAGASPSPGRGPVPDAPVAEAAMHNDLEGVRALIRQGADVNAALGDGMTALHWAAQRGNAELARLLVGARANVEAGTRIGHYTPLHVAARGGHAAVVRVLLDAGADATARTTNSGATALHFAAAAVGGEAIVPMLLGKGADPNAREATLGQTPLIFAAAANRGTAVTALIRGGADPALTTKVEDVISRTAIDRNAEEMLQAILGDMRKTRGPDWVPSVEEMQEAIRLQREQMAEDWEVEVGTLVTRSMKQAFGVATVPQDRLPIREVLVYKTGGMTALHHAARVGNLDAALALLDAGADVNEVSPADGASALVLATLNGYWDLALALLERGADPNLATTTDGVAPLFATLQTQWAASSIYPQPRGQDIQKAEYTELVKALLAKGADPNARLKTHLWSWEYSEARLGTNITGATPFWRAAYAQDLEMMKVLVAAGADPHIPTLTPPIEMRENRQQDGRQEDSFSGVDGPYIPEGLPALYPIHGVAGGGYLGIGAYTVKGVPSAFMPALKYLVEEHQADVNASDWWGYTPLHYAASRGDTEMIQYLVDHGADPTRLTRMGQSVADMARGGQGGFFQRVAYPAAVDLAVKLGSELVCLNVHFSGTGDQCELAGKTDFEQHMGDLNWRYKNPNQPTLD